MNWDNEAGNECSHMSHGFGTGFVGGARWMREQMRTDDSVDVLVRAIFVWDDHDWGDADYERERQHDRDRVRNAINALIGDTA